MKNLQSFATAGKAIFTIQSNKTGKHFTYQVLAPKKVTPKGGVKMDWEAKIRFVRLLTGPNNTSDYSYLGTLHLQDDGSWAYNHGKKSQIGADAPSSIAFAWTWERRDNLPSSVHVHHEGCCARCGKKLTVPESIESGFGPECIKHI